MSLLQNRDKSKQDLFKLNSFTQTYSLTVGIYLCLARQGSTRLVVHVFNNSSTATAYTQGIRPYALCVMLFNMFRRLVLGAYCMVIGGIPAHNEGILDGSLSVSDCGSFAAAGKCLA